MPNTFNFNSKNIRVIIINGQVEFIAKDVAKALGYKNHKAAVKRHCRAYGVTKRTLTDIKGRFQEVITINEPNLYRLIVRSKLSSARKFEAWVFEELLPTIRQDGVYISPQISSEQLKSLKNLISQLEEDNKKLIAKEKLFGNKTPFGKPSVINGLPRVKIVRGHLRSAPESEEITIKNEDLQLLLPFNYKATKKPL